MQRHTLAALVVAVLCLGLARMAPAHADGPDFTPFAGPWLSHAGSMTVDTNGVVWEQGNGFTNPNHNPPIATMQLTSVNDNPGGPNTAYGYLLSDGSSVFLSLLPFDMLNLTQYVDGSPTGFLFCGPNVPSAVLQLLLATGRAGASGCGP